MENNNQDIKLCPACGAKNKAAYKYCNECGTPLNQNYYSGVDNENTPPVYNNIQNGQNSAYNSGKDFGEERNDNAPQYNGQFSQGGYTPYSPFGENINAPYYGTPDFSGASAKDVYDFTGENPELFYKIRTQHFSGKNTPYCWPMFILGLLLDFFGIACWYLYHKMYKPAMGFLAISFANIALKTYALFLVFGSITPEQIRVILNSPDRSYDILSEIATDSNLIFVSLINSATNLINVVALILTIVLPFYAYKQYKNFALGKIFGEYSKSLLPNLKASGGSNVGAVVVATIAYILITVITFVASILPFIGTVIKVAEEEHRNPKSNYYSDKPFEERLPFDFDDDSGIKR